MSRVEQISDYKLDSLILSEKIAEIEKMKYWERFHLIFLRMSAYI